MCRGAISGVALSARHSGPLSPKRLRHVSTTGDGASMKTTQQPQLKKHQQSKVEKKRKKTNNNKSTTTTIAISEQAESTPPERVQSNGAMQSGSRVGGLRAERLVKVLQRICRCTARQRLMSALECVVKRARTRPAARQRKRRAHRGTRRCGRRRKQRRTSGAERGRKEGE